MKQKNRGQIKRIIVGISIFLFIVAAMGGNAVPLHAASQYEDVLGFVIGLNSEGETEFAVPAFVVMWENNSSLIPVLVAGTYDQKADTVAFITNAGNSLVLDENEKAENDDFFLWQLDDVDRDMMLSDDAFLLQADPIQNQDANVIYFLEDSNGEIIVTSESVKLKELQDRFLEVEGMPGDMAYYPAPVLNGAGQFVAMVPDKDTVYTLFEVDSEVFYGGSSGSAPDSGGSGSSGEDSGSGGQDDRERDTDRGSDSGTGTGGGKSFGEGSDAETKNYYQELGEYLGKILVGMAIMGIGITVLILGVKKTRKGKAIPPVPPEQHTIPDQFSSGAGGEGEMGGIYYPPDEIGPTLPPVEQEYRHEEEVHVQPAKLWLVARGGYMDGRLYPVGKDGVTIGRDISNVINYPKNTRGVSRTHCKLYWDEGRLMLMDCNSSSGTFVKGIGTLQPMHPVEIKGGDVFYIGEKNNSFQIKE